jgi:hypothetical protein
MKNAPSVISAARKNLTCRAGMNSGWRALASRNFELDKPIPMHDPAAGIAINNATASGKKSD